MGNFSQAIIQSKLHKEEFKIPLGYASPPPNLDS